MNPTLKFIGYIDTPYQSVEECPRNIDPDGPLCRLVIADDYKEGLTGLETGQEILILYWFEGTDRQRMLQKSRNGNTTTGTFALRSPHRPNPIAAAVLPIASIDEASVVVRGLDCVNGTRLLDIKPAIMLEKRQ